MLSNKIKLPTATDRECNVIIGNISDKDKDLFFGPLNKEEVFVNFPVHARFPDIMHAFGVFKSKSQAKKNGWDKDIPEGFWMKEKIGKLKLCITILKITG